MSHTWALHEHYLQSHVSAAALEHSTEPKQNPAHQGKLLPSTARPTTPIPASKPLDTWSRANGNTYIYTHAVGVKPRPLWWPGMPTIQTEQCLYRGMNSVRSSQRDPSSTCGGVFASFASAGMPTVVASNLINHLLQRAANLVETALIAYTPEPT